MKRMTIPALVLASSLAINGCATRTVFICPTLPEPEFPTVPEIDGLQCISDEAAERLNERELLILEWGEDMETIISTHNNNCRGQDGTQ